MKITIACVSLLLFSTSGVWAGADLAIGDDEVYHRPNSWSKNELGSPPPFKYAASRTGVSIAWRNADQVEEVEVRVVNLGDKSGDGRVSVDVVDAQGHILLSLNPPEGQEVVHMPAAADGGLQGKIIRMKASWELNGLIDRFDLGHIQYGVMATVEPTTPDDDLTNNRKCKTWNNMLRVTPSATNTFNYAFKNYDTNAKEFKLSLLTSKLPSGWTLKDSNERRGTVKLSPGEILRGTLSLSVPDNIEEGAFSEARISLIDAQSGEVYRQHEWFEIYDTVPPVISNYRAILLQNHTIAIQALVADQQSGVLEATGVSTQFSVDGGKTWAAKAHNYKTGNFVRPTLFETVIGPFSPKTNVMLRMTARDTAGNVAWRIPDDASAFMAPAGAEQLMQLAYIFPRTKPNPLFEVEGLRALAQSVKAAQAKGVDIKKLNEADLVKLGLSSQRLAELGVDSARFEDLKSDVQQLGLLNLHFDQIQPTPLRHVQAAGESVLPVNTVEVTVQ
jgi:hypothetical protein